MKNSRHNSRLIMTAGVTVVLRYRLSPKQQVLRSSWSLSDLKYSPWTRLANPATDYDPPWSPWWLLV